jgi:hypothetical protein
VGKGPPHHAQAFPDKMELSRGVAVPAVAFAIALSFAPPTYHFEHDAVTGEVTIRETVCFSATEETGWLHSWSAFFSTLRSDK